MPTKPKSAPSKMQAYRERLRAQGLKPVQIWVPDVDAPGFDKELRQQAARLDPAHEEEVMRFIEAAADFSEE